MDATDWNPLFGAKPVLDRGLQGIQGIPGTGGGGSSGSIDGGTATTSEGLTIDGGTSTSTP